MGTMTTNPVAAKLAETSYYKLAVKVGTTPSFLSRVFRKERSPTIRTAQRIAAALEVTMEELCDHIGWPGKGKRNGKRKQG